MTAKVELYTTIFNNPDMATEWQVFVENNTHHIELKSLSTIERARTYLTNKVSDPVRDRIVKYLIDKNLLPGYVGSGQYSNEQVALFTKIKQKIDAGEILAAGTPIQYNDDATKKDFIYASHSYSLIGYQDGWVKYVVLRNPWGDTGVAYDEQDLAKGTPEGAYGTRKKLVPKKAQDGTFDLELTQFTSTFNALYSTDGLLPLDQRG